MNNNQIIGLILVIFGQAAFLHATQIYRPPEPYPAEKVETLEKSLRMVLARAGSEDASLRDMPFEIFFPKDAPREIHVANVMKIANEFLEEADNRKTADRKAEEIATKDFSLLMLMNIMGDLRYGEFLSWLEQRAESPWGSVRERAAINYVKIAGLDAVVFLRKFAVAHPNQSSRAVEELLNQVDLNTTLEPKINSAYEFLLEFIQHTSFSEDANRVDKFLGRHITEYTNSLQRAEMARHFYNTRNIRILDKFNPIKERFDKLPFEQRVDMRHRFPSLPVAEACKEKPAKISASSAANADHGDIPKKELHWQPIGRVRMVNPSPAFIMATNATPLIQDAQLHSLKEVIEKTLDVNPYDLDISMLDAFVVTNEIPDNLLVSTVESVAEEKLLEYGPNGGYTDKDKNIWLLMIQLGNTEFLPFLDKQSRSVYSRHYQLAADAYVRIAGIDASFFLREKFKNSRSNWHGRVWWESTEEVFFEVVKQAEMQHLPTAKINTAYMVLIEHVMQTYNLREANFLDNWLCGNLPGYVSSIQRKRTINRFADYPDKLVSNPFLDKKLEFEARFQGELNDLERRFVWLSRLRDIEYRSFTWYENIGDLKKELVKAKEQGLPWHKVILPSIHIRGREDAFSLVGRIKNVLSDSYDFKVHWQAPKPIEMFVAIEARSIPTDLCLSLIFDLFDLFEFQTDNALFVCKRPANPMSATATWLGAPLRPRVAASIPAGAARQVRSSSSRAGVG